ncbi:MAG: hypothetical protein U1A25_01470 [Candidatus Sungbacteria bacterium]|nr:hypothetical protein [bacterium]MDZ4260310.1 hypothetical protein [Candidatus Sungbacteria bacterium]
MEETPLAGGKKIIVILLIILTTVGILSFYFLRTFFVPPPIAAPNQTVSPVNADGEKFTEGKALLHSDSDASLRILKSLAADQKADPYYRARAIAFLANLSGYFSQTDVINKLFSGDIWGDFYHPGESTRGIAEDIDLAKKKAYEWSLGLAPTALANQRIAWWHVRQLQDDRSLSPQVREQYLSLIKERIASNEQILKNDIALGMNLNELQTIYLIEGLINGSGMYLQTHESEYKQRAINAYEKAIGIDPIGALLGSYQLANLLRITEGKNQEERIHELLDFVVNSYKAYPNSFVYNHFTKERSDAHKLHTHTQDLIDTAVFYPPFRDLLIELGWPLERFKTK